MKKPTTDERAEIIDEALRLVWDSLESHLLYTHEEHHDDKEFHKKTVREYIKLMDCLSRLY